MPKVTVIPASINPKTHLPEKDRNKRKVAGYARVSTDSDEQFTSFNAQTEYYTKLIRSNPEWEFVHVYTDEGISGLNTRKRTGFKEMIDDALAGKIDLIITKSVSRFARNTVDSLKTIRELKKAGTEVYFEKENIYTFDGKGELLLTIMSSLAQEESRSISENITWGHRRSFESGKVHIPYGIFLGYKKGADGKPEIDEEKADIVRLIYRLFLDGKTPVTICKYLEDKGIHAPMGGDRWSNTTVLSILTNEKYKGHALLQKTFTTDFLEKTKKINEGEVPQYYVEDSHPAIIDPDIWDFVQLELARRKTVGKAYSGKSTLSSKLICEDCGGFYGQKVWHSTDKYRCEIWQCNAKFKNEAKCGTPTFTTDEIHQLFIRAYNQVMNNVPRIVEDCSEMRKLLADTTDLDRQIDEKTQESELLAEMVRELIHRNASSDMTEDALKKQEESLNARFETVTKELYFLKEEREKRIKKDNALSLHIRNLNKSKKVLTEWDDTVWTVMVEKAIVHKDKSISFIFYNGSKVRVGN